MKQTYASAVEKVVAFWVEKSFRTRNNYNNGDRSFQGTVIGALANKLSNDAQSQISDEQIERFSQKLREILLSLEHSHILQRNIGVDYNPEPHLREAADFAGVNTSCLPVKTYSRIDNEYRAFASCGYGSPEIEL